MDEISIPADIMRDLIVRTRNYMAREEVVTEGRDDSGPEDEDIIATLDAKDGDSEYDELVDEINGLDEDQKLELVALMWVGRGDFDADDWEEAIQEAAARHKGPTAQYLLTHPLVGDHWADGLDMLFDGTDLFETGKY